MKNLENLPVRAQLRLLATTDLHMNLTGYDYYADRIDLSLGLTRTAALIHIARKEAAENGMLSLLFDNGDSLQGTPLGEVAINNPDQPHPLMQSFKHLRYDAIGLGNHDFNFGLERLLAVLSQAPCPVVSTNLRRIDGRCLPGISPFAVLDRTVRVNGLDYPVRIGVLSFLPPQTVQWDARLLENHMVAGDIPKAARHGIAELEQRDCDIIIALAHSGLDDTPVHDNMENAVLPLAAMPGIDAVIAGHTHLHLPGSDHPVLKHVDAKVGSAYDKPVVMPGSAGSHLGVIDLDLKPGPAKSSNNWTVASFQCALRPVLNRKGNDKAGLLTAEDPILSALLASAHAETRASLAQPVGRSQYPLHSYFSLFAPCRALAVVAAAQASALRGLLAGTKAGDYPVLSAVAPCKFGGRSGPLHYTDVPASQVSLRHVADLYVFPNELRAVIVTGRQVAQWLEKSAVLFQQIIPGSSGTPLTKASVPGNNFDVLHGLTWQIDLSARPGCRISNIRHGDAEITSDQKFVVALNNYRASGGGNFNFLKDAEPITIPTLGIRDLLRDYLSGRMAADPLGDAPCAWRFRPMPGTRVAVQTGPGAMTHLDELTGLNITASGIDSDGFLNITLSL